MPNNSKTRGRVKPINALTVIRWFSAEVATTWPEGSTVLRALPAFGGVDVRSIEFGSYHRPDWCDKNHEYYSQLHGKMKFALLGVPARLLGKKGNK